MSFIYMLQCEGPHRTYYQSQQSVLFITLDYVYGNLLSVTGDQKVVYIVDECPSRKRMHDLTVKRNAVK